VTDPRPLLEADATEIEKVLLLAGRTDGPPVGAGARLLAAIEGAPGAPSVPPALPVGIERVALVRWAKIAFVTLGVGGAAAVTYQVVRPRGVEPSVMPLRQVVPTTASVALPGAVPASRHADDGPATVRGRAPEQDTGESPAPAQITSPSGRGREAAREASASPIDRSLGEETRALDRAREALDARRSGEALRTLDEYHRRFPQGRLRPEAMVLRLAALVQAGRRAAADSLASQLLANPAYRTYAPRIRSLLGGAKP
jgi:hypothetical protein